MSSCIKAAIETDFSLGYRPIKQNTELAESKVIMDTKGKMFLPTTDMVNRGVHP